MKRLGALIIALVAASHASAQSSTATGVGVGVSSSTSHSTAVATSGTGGTGVGRVRTTTVVSTNPSTTINSSVPANQTLTNVPAVFAPGLSAAGLETCLGSVSVGASWLGTGLTGGGSIPDAGCAARLDARTLWSMGLKKAAVARLCLNNDIYRAMPDVCVQYLPRTEPVVAPVAYAGGNIWLIEGATGKNRLCSDYDEPRKRCRVWAHVYRNAAAQ